jgi:hypothetical protein
MKPEAFYTVLLSPTDDPRNPVESGYVTAGGAPMWHNMLRREVPTHWMPVPKSPKKTAKKGKTK